MRKSRVQIRDRHVDGGDQYRKFRRGDDSSCSDLRPGTIVCLRNGGNLMIAKQGNSKGSWEIAFAPFPRKFQSIPVEGLFSVLRRGNHLGFQSLGAEGRLIQASDRPDAPHSLAHGFGNRESWEPAARSGRLVNAHLQSKELGAQVHPVTALPTSQLVTWEDDTEVQVQQLQSQLDTRTEAAASSERHAAELVKAGARAAVKEQKEAEELRCRLETSNRIVLHWQEEAALTGEALREAEATVRELRRQVDGLNTPRERKQEATNNKSNSEEDEILLLRSKIAVLEVQHAQQLEFIEAQHAEELAAAVAAVAASGSGNGYGEENEEHAALVERLLEERARLDSALRCIKDMTRHMYSGDCSDDDEEREESSGGQSQHRDSGGGGMAVGIPIDDAAADGSAAWSGSSFTLRPERPSSAESGSTLSLSVAAELLPPGEGAFNVAAFNIAAAAEEMGEGVEFPRFPELHRYQEITTTTTTTTNNNNNSSLRRGQQQQQQQQELEEMYHFTAPVMPQQQDQDGRESEGFASPSASFGGESIDADGDGAEITGGGGGRRGGRRSAQSFHSCGSLHRVSQAGGGLFVVEYRGERPDAVTEAALNRILDAPSLPNNHTNNNKNQAKASRRSGSGVVRNDDTDNNAADPVAYLLSSSGVDHTTPPGTRGSRRGMCPPSASCPTSTAKSDILGDLDSPAVWAAGSLSLPGSNCASPGAEGNNKPREPEDAAERRRTAEQEEAEEEVCELRRSALDITAAVYAMDRSSPAAANLMAQYMSDHVAVRASMPTLHFVKQRGVEAEAQERHAAARGEKIPAVRRSAPVVETKVSRRASFLNRAPVAERDLYGGRFF